MEKDLLETIERLVEGALSKIRRTDLYDDRCQRCNTKGSPLNEQTFKMMVLTAIQSSSIVPRTASEYPVKKRDTAGNGFADLALIVDEELWLIELKYYPLNLLNGKEWGFAENGMQIPCLEKRKDIWSSKSKEQLRQAKFYLPLTKPELIEACRDGGYEVSMTANNKPLLSLESLEYLAALQVKNYYHEKHPNPRYFTIVGAGTSVFIKEVEE